MPLFYSLSRTLLAYCYLDVVVADFSTCFVDFTYFLLISNLDKLFWQTDVFRSRHFTLLIRPCRDPYL